MNVGIIGGGMMGLCAAHYLAAAGATVTVLEQADDVGGLSRSDEVYPGVRWDRFYHVILTTDTDLLRFVEEIGLGLQVDFRQTRSGFFIDGRMHSMSSIKEFLTFRPLSFADKIRLGVGLLYATNVRDWKRLEKLYVKAWLIKVFGRRNFEKMWDPLLRAKLGPAAERTSAAFIWATIKRLYGTRQQGSKREMMGCVRGGYHSILQNLCRKLRERGVVLYTNWPVAAVRGTEDGGVQVVNRRGESRQFDQVLATVPNPCILNWLPDAPRDFRARLAGTEYLGVVCMTLVLRRSLSPFYVTNLTDTTLPFTGLIEATHVIPQDVLNGRTLIYLPRYLPSDDPFLAAPDDAIRAVFLTALKRMFPSFSDADILSSRIHRERYVQPVYSLGYSETVPPIRTPLKNFFMVNTSMILNSTLNNNQVVQLARGAVGILREDACA